MSERKPTHRTTTHTKTTHAKAKPKAKPEPEPEVEKPSPESLIRRKASLIAGLKSATVTNDAAIREELAQEPMLSTPILSYHEIKRLDG